MPYVDIDRVEVTPNRNEQQSIERLSLIEPERARNAARLIVAHLGKLQDAVPQFNFGLYKPDTTNHPAVILTNSVCGYIEGQGEFGGNVMIDINPDGRFTVQLGNGDTYLGDGNVETDVEAIGERISTAQTPWRLYG
jgi:hypothetical protein